MSKVPAPAGKAPAAAGKAPSKAPSKAPTKSVTPAAPAGADKKTTTELSEGLRLHVTDTGTAWTFVMEVYQKRAQKGTIFVDLTESSGVKLIVKKPAAPAGPMTLSVKTPPGTGSAVVATVEREQPQAKLSYQVRLSESPDGEEDSVTELAEGLSIICRNSSTGYTLAGVNKNAEKKTFHVTIDLGQSENLDAKPHGTTKKTGPLVLELDMEANGAEVDIGACDVVDMSIGSCNIRYKMNAKAV